MDPKTTAMQADSPLSGPQMVHITSRMALAAAQELHIAARANGFGPDVPWDALTDADRGRYLRDATSVLTAGMAAWPVAHVAPRRSGKTAAAEALADALQALGYAVDRSTPGVVAFTAGD